MTIWTGIFLLANSLLCIRLLLFSDQDRKASRWGYRLALFLLTVYAGKQVIDIFYHPQLHTGPMTAVVHAGLLFASILMRPEYLPWNCSYDDSKQAYCRLGHFLVGSWHGIWNPRLYGGQGKSRSRGR